MWFAVLHDAVLPYVDVGELGFEAAMNESQRHLLG
jgi:hypothetical protein